MLLMARSELQIQRSLRVRSVFARHFGRVLYGVARSAELEFGVAVGQRAFGISQLTRHKHHNF